MQPSATSVRRVQKSAFPSPGPALLKMGLRFTAVLVMLLPATCAWSWQTPSKPPSNPLSALIKEKPKAAVVAPELPAAIPEQPAAIPLPDVAARSLELGQTLREKATNLPTREELDAIKSAISELEPSLATKQVEVDALLSGSPNSLQIREEENFWRGTEDQTSDWQQKLLTWAKAAQDALVTLDSLEPAWSATYELNKTDHELAPVLSVVDSNLADMKRLRTQAKEALQASVNLQIRVGNLDANANAILARLATAQLNLKGHLLDRDSLPLWRVNMRRELGETNAGYRPAESRWISILTFIKEASGTLVFLVILFVLCALAARRLHQWTLGKPSSDRLDADAFRVLKHWVAVGLLPPLMIGYLIAPSAPVTVLGLLILVSFFPILVILPPLLQPRSRVVLYVFTSMFGLHWLVAWVRFNPEARREVEFLYTAVFAAIFAYFSWPTRNRKSEVGWHRVPLVAVRLLVLAMVFRLVADLFGFIKLAHYVTLASVYSAILGICVFTGWRVVILLLTVGLRFPVAERLAVVRLHHDAIVRWAPRLLTWLAVFIWVVGSLDLLGILDPLLARINLALDFHIGGSSGGATVGGVLSFFFILALGYAAASSIRFLFREEIFRHFQLSRGLPELISSIIYYMLLIVFVLAAVNAGGIELNKFTVLTGAFGVGIGFGLQNIINNFVSGLILQFERPIHVDDILEVDTSLGKVTRIGIRSSTIQTFQGAEVILPNATLISNKVINWTLSESRRRRELPVGVAYGSDPKVVLRILTDAAAQHELVLSKPEPNAYFKGFGDSSLDFELHFWVMQENNGLQISSDVAMSIMQSLDEAGIEIPFPQRDLRLRSVDPSVMSAGQLGRSSDPAADASPNSAPSKP